MKLSHMDDCREAIRLFVVKHAVDFKKAHEVCDLIIDE